MLRKPYSTPGTFAAQAVLQMQRNGQDYYYHADDQFNVVAVTDGAGAVVERYDYGDFGYPEFYAPDGTPRDATAIGNPWLFTGRPWDSELGAYYYRTRYFDPLAGRFLSPDSIGNWADPLNLGNAYTYTGNNPWSWVDPYGMTGDGGFAGALGTTYNIASAIPGSVWNIGKEMSYILVDGATAGFVLAGNALVFSDPVYADDIQYLGSLAQASNARITAGQNRAVSALTAEGQLIAGPFMPVYNSSAAYTAYFYGDITVDQLEFLTTQAAADATAVAVVGYTVARAVEVACPLTRSSASGEPDAAPRPQPSELEWPQDAQVNPKPPARLQIRGRRIGESDLQNELVQEVLREAQKAGAADIRLNQQQVNVLRERVGINVPDAQYTLTNRTPPIRVYIEVDRRTSPRGPLHVRRILQNDPDGIVISFTLD